jgi:hypothetical protein
MIDARFDVKVVKIIGFLKPGFPLFQLRLPIDPRVEVTETKLLAVVTRTANYLLQRKADPRLY